MLSTAEAHENGALRPRLTIMDRDVRGQDKSPPAPILFRDLAADFAALVGFGVDVEIPLPRREVGGLGICQRGGTFDRACHTALDAQGVSRILAGLGRSLEMRRGGGA